jgi:hypothetical protein
MDELLRQYENDFELRHKFVSGRCPERLTSSWLQCHVDWSSSSHVEFSREPP